ncbi:unnamed protein product [Prunus armeniaca]|uniref:PPM-type phosphatase domain-containing protein n=1 Tax=Prunus armeniaca TaxID=36596 RepID=A0A6J5YCJ9_PRUAR|nr:unnamed protein product [Prunus armeniaca]CAB4321274.1 unnamed protein product [Prunus armeniaca]
MAFGATMIKKYKSCEPYLVVEMTDDDIEFLVLASHGIWKAMSNQQVVNSIRSIKNAEKSAKHLTKQAFNAGTLLLLL